MRKGRFTIELVCAEANIADLKTNISNSLTALKQQGKVEYGTIKIEYIEIPETITV